MEDARFILKLLLVEICLLLFVTLLIILFIRIKNRISINKKFKKYTINYTNNKTFSFLCKFKKYVFKIFMKIKKIY